MKRWRSGFLVLLCVPALASAQAPEIVAAATKFVPGVKWKPESIVVGDFSCHGETDRAILGTSKSEIVVVVFLGSLTKRPKVLRYSASARDPATAELTTENIDFEPKKFESEFGYVPEGLRPSKTCQGLNMSDGKIDSAHIYWNHNAKEFGDWVL